MSSSFSTWFLKGINPGSVITLNQPFSSQWKILEKLNEHEFQVNKEENNDYGFCSFASAKFQCCDPKQRSKEAFMRIYIQVPHRKTEMDDANTRGQQATTFTPPELLAYQDLTQKHSINTPKLIGYKTDTQDRSGLVPGGFIISGLFGKSFQGDASEIAMALVRSGLLKATKESESAQSLSRLFRKSIFLLYLYLH